MIIKALIIEDEKLAAEHLINLINSSDFNIEVIGTLESISKAISWFRKNPAPDLVFLDIQLSDGLSFEIFNQVNISCPVIFTTAYEEYAIKGFKLNSIDYLLKPISSEDLTIALKQYLSYSKNIKEKMDLSLKYRIDQMMMMVVHQYKTRFVVNAGVHIRSIEVERIVCFYSLEKASYLLDNHGKTYDVNYSLEQLEKLLDPAVFFRINRKYLVNINFIRDIIAFSASRLKLKIDRLDEDVLFVSRSKVKEFKNWLEQ